MTKPLPPIVIEVARDETLIAHRDMLLKALEAVAQTQNRYGELCWCFDRRQLNSRYKKHSRWCRQAREAVRQVRAARKAVGAASGGEEQQ
jgi:hypothetical protein